MCTRLGATGTCFDRERKLGQPISAVRTVPLRLALHGTKCRPVLS